MQRGWIHTLNESRKPGMNICFVEYSGLRISRSTHLLSECLCPTLLLTGQSLTLQTEHTMKSLTIVWDQHSPCPLSQWWHYCDQIVPSHLVHLTHPASCSRISVFFLSFITWPGSSWELQTYWSHCHPITHLWISTQQCHILKYFIGAYIRRG